MDLTTLFSRLGLLLAVMAALAVVETMIPLFASGPAYRRHRASNLALTLMYFAINFALSAAVLGVSALAEERRWGLLYQSGWSVLTQGIIGFVLLDFFGYAVHVLMHKVGWMWRFHRVHHSDLAVDVTTAFRQHPGEAVFRFVFASVPGLLLGVSPVGVALYRTVSGVNALFEHANIRVPDWLDRPISWLLVTPNMHKMHHSRRHLETDSNYSNIFACYDHLFRTFTDSGRIPTLRYGLDGFDEERDQSLKGLLALPAVRRNAGNQPLKG